MQNTYLRALFSLDNALESFFSSRGQRQYFNKVFPLLLNISSNKIKSLDFLNLCSRKRSEGHETAGIKCQECHQLKNSVENLITK